MAGTVDTRESARGSQSLRAVDGTGGFHAEPLSTAGRSPESWKIALAAWKAVRHEHGFWILAMGWL